jgi:hypothetical protein
MSSFNPNNLKPLVRRWKRILKERLPQSKDLAPEVIESIIAFTLEQLQLTCTSEFGHPTATMEIRRCNGPSWFIKLRTVLQPF